MSKRRADALVACLETMGHPFESAADCPWLDTLEQSYRLRLPEPFRSLVRYYRWPEFDVGPLAAFSNLGVHDDDDLLKAPFRDKPILEWLQANGLIQIGRLATGSYDPVCLNLAARGARASIVSIDHEGILLCRRKVRVTQLSTSLEELIAESADDDQTHGE
ncbi:MAG: hypothetical protein KDI56_07000 [Xanthomonadales bacterium]|nr:hypothetical protein [Xanthomonadales bacterium]